MEDEKDAFYVVKKGDVVGIYKSLSIYPAQLNAWVNDPSISVFKGYGLSKEAENYLVNLGLKNACYSLNVADVQNDLFGKLFPCLSQQPFPYRAKSSGKGSLSEALRRGPNSVQVASTALPIHPEVNHLKSGSSLAVHDLPSDRYSCILEFDGASRGNPGPAGAGAVLRALDGSMVFRLREGLGTVTNNVAEYRALILGLKQALRKGFRNIRVQGDSNLVCMQVQGLWKIKSQNLVLLCKEARELKDRFLSFSIKHIPRELNSEADAQANLAVDLRDGRVEEDCLVQ